MLSRLQLPKSSIWQRCFPWKAGCCPTTARPSPVVGAALLVHLRHRRGSQGQVVGQKYQHSLLLLVVELDAAEIAFLSVLCLLVKANHLVAQQTLAAW